MRELAIGNVWEDLCRVRERAPLVHNITNLVVMNTTANALLAVGASPVMAHAPEEVEEMVALAGALVVNIGTLSSPWIAAMRLAARRARELGRPWLLDPVGAGATRLRDAAAAGLVALRPDVVRGNGSEIAALAGPDGIGPDGIGQDGTTKGVDSTRSAEAALSEAQALAARIGAVVAVTGAVDLVTDGPRVCRLANGNALMARVTGLGCTASALAGAFLAVQPDRFQAAVSALAVLGVAGEIAAEGAAGPGSLQLRLLDTLYGLDRAALAGRLRIG